MRDEHQASNSRLTTPALRLPEVTLSGSSPSEGLVERIEPFDREDEAEALARFEELSRLPRAARAAPP